MSEHVGFQIRGWRTNRGNKIFQIVTQRQCVFHAPLPEMVKNITTRRIPERASQNSTQSSRRARSMRFERAKIQHAAFKVATTSCGFATSVLLSIAIVWLHPYTLSMSCKSGNACVRIFRTQPEIRRFTDDSEVAEES